MKKFLFVLIVSVFSLFLFLSIKPDDSGITKPYQDTDSQLLIPQRNIVIAAVDLERSGISLFSEKTLGLLEGLSNRLLDIQGVTGVDSILNANTVISTEDEILISSIIPPESERVNSFFDELPGVIVEHQELKPYINNSMDSLLFYIYFGYRIPPPEIEQALENVKSEFSGLVFEYTGKSPITAKTEKLLTGDIVVFIPLLLLLVMVVFLSFRNIKAIAAAWFLIILAVITSYGFIRFLGVKNSPMLLLIPVFCLGLLSDYIIHYFYHLFYAPGIHDVYAVRRKIFFPLTLTAVSTLTGFLSLLFINGSGHILLGSLIAASVVITFIGVFFWLPYLKYKLPSKDILPRFQRFQVKFFSGIVKRRRIVYVLLLVVIVWGLFLLPKLKIEPYPIEQLPSGSTIKKADEIINSDFYGTLPYFIEIDTGGESGVLSRNALLVLDKIHSMLDNSEVVGYSYSFLTVLKQLSYYFEGDRDILLKDDALGDFVIEQYLLYYSSSVDPLEYESLVNSSYRVCSVKGLLYYKNIDSLTEFYNIIERVNSTLPSSWSLKVHGMVRDLKQEETSLRRNWIFSFASGSLLIFIMVLVYYRKPRLALLSLVPGVVSMIFSFGLISLAGISIDAFSIIFVAIIMGLVVDYSIHTLGAINSLTGLKTLEEGFLHIINYSGKPIFLSFLTSLFSFSVLFLSSFKGARTLGLLLFSSLMISFFLSVYLMPIIILPYKLKKEKEVIKDTV